MVTNQIYEYFQQMLDNFNGNNILYETGVCYLFSLKPDNPYPVGTEEHHLFNKLSSLCATWQRGGVDAKVSFRRLIAFSKKFCELVHENPFTPVVEEPVVAEVSEPETKKVVNEQQETVLGVVPEEKKSFFKRNKKKEGKTNDSP